MMFIPQISTVLSGEIRYFTSEKAILLHTKIIMPPPGECVLSILNALKLENFMHFSGVSHDFTDTRMSKFFNKTSTSSLRCMMLLAFQNSRRRFEELRPDCKCEAEVRD